MSTPTRVAFVAVGAMATPEQYVRYAESYVSLLDQHKVPAYPRENEKQTQRFDARVFTEVEPALKWLEPADGGGRTLVLLSEMLGNKADEIAQKNPNIYVLVFGGALPQRGKALYVRKKWTGARNIADIVER